MPDKTPFAEAMIEAVDESLLACLRDGRIVASNRAANELFRFARGNLAGRSLDGLVVDEPSRAAIAKSLTAAWEHSESFADVSARADDDGEPFPARLIMRAARGVDGATAFLTVRVRTDSDSVSGDRVSSDLQADFRQLIEAAPDAMIVTDADGRIILANKETERVFGYQAQELIGSSVEILVPERFRGGHTAFRGSYLSHPRRRPMGAGIDLFARRKDGSEFPAEISLSPLRTNSGSVVTAAIRDITERRRLEEMRRQALAEESRRAHEANRLKSEFLANMSHELRTPLNAIIGFTELMHDGKVGPVSEDHKEYLGDILTSSRHLLQLINDVLDLAKVEAGRMEFRPESIDLTKVFHETNDILRPLAAKKLIRIETHIDPSLTGIVSDPGRLKQVLYNYLSNALKFTPDNGVVTLRAIPHGDEYFRLEVADTGIGIAPEQLQSLFQQFRQLDASTAKKYQGTGLGLSLTKRIVEAQGGEVGARSTPGHGSVFFAVLPRVSKVVVEQRPDHTPIERAGAPCVLVVEDDAADRAWIVSALSGLGYNVHTASTGSEAIANASAKSFDAITLDLLLPDMSGWTVLRTIREAGPNTRTPTIVVTLVSERGAGLVYPINDFLRKPVESSEIGASLRRAGVLPGGERPVLVVDDDSATRKMLDRALTQEGYRCVLATDGEEGLRIAGEAPPAAVVLDLLMPGVDGFEFLERFRLSVAGARTPVIVWTSKDLSGEERGRLELSAQAVVSKGTGGTTALIARLKPYLPAIVTKTPTEGPGHGE